MQERCNSIANALELHLSCTNPLISFISIGFLTTHEQFSEHIVLLCFLLLCLLPSVLCGFRSLIYLLIFYSVAWLYMMTSSNGNIFSVTGHLCGEFTGPGEFPAQRPVTRSFDVLFDLRLNKGLSKQWWGWWFETLSRPLWHHRNELGQYIACSSAKDSPGGIWVKSTGHKTKQNTTKWDKMHSMPFR